MTLHAAAGLAALLDACVLVALGVTHDKLREVREAERRRRGRWPR